MILVDANLLVYAHVSDFEQHERARVWLDGCLNAGERVGVPWASLLAFMRLTTNPRVFKQPLPVAAAWKQVEAWLDVPNVFIPSPTDRHRDVLALLMPEATHANLVPDAHLYRLICYRHSSSAPPKEPDPCLSGR